MAAFAASLGSNNRRKSVVQDEKNRRISKPLDQILADEDFDEPSTDAIVTINVGGEVFQTYKKTLERYPRSLLGDRSRRSSYWNEETREYYFNRNRSEPFSFISSVIFISLFVCLFVTVVQDVFRALGTPEPEMSLPTSPIQLYSVCQLYPS